MTSRHNCRCAICRMSDAIVVMDATLKALSIAHDELLDKGMEDQMQADYYRDTLEAIATGALPCLHCDEVHVWRLNDPQDPKKGGSWMMNGHAYVRPDAGAYARRVQEHFGRGGRPISDATRRKHDHDRTI